MTTPTAKIDIWPTLSTVALILLLLLGIFSYQNSTDYKKLMESLTQEKDSLKNVILIKEKDIETQLKKVERMDSLQSRINTLEWSRDILKKTIKRNAENYNYIKHLSTDNNIKLLSKQLSSENSCK